MLKLIFKTFLLALVCAIPVASPTITSANSTVYTESANLTVSTGSIYLRQSNGSYVDSTSTTAVSGTSLYDLNGNFIGALLQNEEGGGTIKGISGDTVGYFTPAT